LEVKMSENRLKSREVSARKEVVKTSWAKAFERVADEIAGIILIVGGMYLVKCGITAEGVSFVNLGAVYLFYRRNSKKMPTSTQGGLPYGS